MRQDVKFSLCNIVHFAGGSQRIQDDRPDTRKNEYSIDEVDLRINKGTLATGASETARRAVGTPVFAGMLADNRTIPDPDALRFIPGRSGVGP